MTARTYVWARILGLRRQAINTIGRAVYRIDAALGGLSPPGAAPARGSGERYRPRWAGRDAVARPQLYWAILRKW